MSEDYDWWNEALSARLLPERLGRPVFLYVDRGVLADASGALDEERAFRAFVTAVRARCAGATPFGWARRRMRAWESEGSPGYPPFIAVLAFTVLAAAERSTTHFQYYDDLNTLLGRTSHHGMPKDFDTDVPALFQGLNRWLEAESRFGSTTAMTPTHYTNVGWPLSQALLRPSDDHALHAAIRRVGVVCLSGMPASQVLARVAPALRTLPESSSRTRLMDALDRHPELLTDRIQRELAAWVDDDGSLRRAAVDRLQLKLVHDTLSGEWWLVARRPIDSQYHSLRIGSWTTGVAGRGAIEVTHPNPWALLGHGDVGEVDRQTRVFAPPAAPKWLRASADVGGWIEQPAADFTVEQLRLLPAGSAESAVLRSLGLDSSDSAPDGWTLWVVPAGTELPGLTDRTTPVRRLALEGGYCLEARTSTYLVSPHGRPRLVGMEDGESVQIDDALRRSDELEAHLRGLPEGLHSVDGGGGRLAFRLLAHLREDLHVGSPIAWTRTDDMLAICSTVNAGERRVIALGAFVDGAEASGPLPEIPFSVGTVWIVGGHGEVAKRQARPLTWLDGVGLAASTTDPRRAMSGLDFSARFVVAFRSAGSPAFVVEVQGEPSSEVQDRDVTPLEHKQLIQQLLTNEHQALPIDVERRWKRTVAAVIKRGLR